MSTITTKELNRSSGVISRALRTGREVRIVFRNDPLALVVPHDQIEQERAELAELRVEVAHLRAKLAAEVATT